MVECAFPLLIPEHHQVLAGASVGDSRLRLHADGLAPLLILTVVKKCSNRIRNGGSTVSLAGFFSPTMYSTIEYLHMQHKNMQKVSPKLRCPVVFGAGYLQYDRQACILPERKRVGRFLMHRR
jgi:hypothetical protein